MSHHFNIYIYIYISIEPSFEFQTSASNTLPAPFIFHGIDSNAKKPVALELSLDSVYNKDKRALKGKIALELRTFRLHIRQRRQKSPKEVIRDGTLCLSSPSVTIGGPKNDVGVKHSWNGFETKEQKASSSCIRDFSRPEECTSLKHRRDGRRAEQTFVPVTNTRYGARLYARCLNTGPAYKTRYRIQPKCRPKKPYSS